MGMLLTARQQQIASNNKDAVVTFVVPGAWPSCGNRKRLMGLRGPLGECLSENESDCLVAFSAEDVCLFAGKELGVKVHPFVARPAAADGQAHAARVGTGQGKKE